MPGTWKGEKTITRFCMNCGSFLYAGSRFCHVCGHEVMQAEATSTRFCMNCGSLLYAGSGFCHSCGHEVIVLCTPQPTWGIEVEGITQAAPPDPDSEDVVPERSKWRSRLLFASKVLGFATLAVIAYSEAKNAPDEDGVAYNFDDCDEDCEYCDHCGDCDRFDDSDDERISTPSVVGPSTGAMLASRSALPRGRMRETDQVKGRNSPLPNSPGIYQHINKTTREVEYVGQTDNLRVRQQRHVGTGKLDTETQFVRWAAAKDTATKDDLCQTEKAHIAKHNPSGNTTRGGNGRRSNG